MEYGPLYHTLLTIATSATKGHIHEWTQRWMVLIITSLVKCRWNMPLGLDSWAIPLHYQIR